MKHLKWYIIKHSQDIITPALLVYPDRIEENIRRMINIAGSVNRLRPHVKTYKMAEVIQLQIKNGIKKFKSATIPETELVAQCQADEVLLALQPVGANIHRFINLIQSYPDTRISTIVDNISSVNIFSSIAARLNIQIDLFVDINNGMNRTGIIPGPEAISLCQQIDMDSKLNFQGLHIYDGHIHESDLDLRKEICERDFTVVQHMINKIDQIGIKIESIVAGGTPTFPIHAQRKDVELSPGTPLLWDAGYAQRFSDLDFQLAALLATRVISHPTNSITCFDLGHKSVAPEMPMPRIKFIDDVPAHQIGHSEEHLVVNHDPGFKPEIGELFYVAPIHICPTVSKYESVYVVKDNQIQGKWNVAARDH